MSTRYCGGRLHTAARFDGLRRHAIGWLKVAVCLAMMLATAACISSADWARRAENILHQRDGIKTLRLSIYLNDSDWRQMQTNGPNLGHAILYGPIGVLGDYLDARSARKDFAAESQLKSRYETNFFRCLSAALVSEIQSNTAFQVTDSRTAPADADLILLVQNITYQTGRRSTWAKRIPAYIASGLITKDPRSVMLCTGGPNFVYATNCWLWNARVSPGYGAQQTRYCVSPEGRPG